MTNLDFLNEPYVVITGFIITATTIIGIFYKGVVWLRDEVKKENVRIRNDLIEENAQIKKETLEQADRNKAEVEGVANNITKELTFTKELISTKLDTLQETSKENKVQLDNYAKDIGRTVSRNNEKVNEHESRLSVLETQIRSFFSKSPIKEYNYDKNRSSRSKSDNDSHNNSEN